MDNGPPKSWAMLLIQVSLTTALTCLLEGRRGERLSLLKRYGYVLGNIRESFQVGSQVVVVCALVLSHAIATLLRYLLS